MPEEIKISYSTVPRGQVGKRPRLVKPGAELTFMTDDPGELTIQFEKDSPLEGGAKAAKGKTVVRVAATPKPGRYPFTCILSRNGEQIILRSSDGQNEGGELEIGTGP